MVFAISINELPREATSLLIGPVAVPWPLCLWTCMILHILIPWAASFVFLKKSWQRTYVLVWALIMVSCAYALFDFGHLLGRAWRGKF